MAARRGALTRSSTVAPGSGASLLGEEMEEGVAGFLGIDNAPDFAAGLNFAGVADLAAHFGVERRSVKGDGDLVFDIDSVQDGGGGGETVESDEIGRMGRIEIGGGDDFLFLGGAGAGALLVHELFEAGCVHGQAALAGHQVR